MHLILASKSPRRRELIGQLGYAVSVVDIAVDETIDGSVAVSGMAEAIAQRKAEAYDVSLMGEDDVLVTADTIVALDCCKLGKPHDRAEAIAMLQRLSGRGHQVYSGVCLRRSDAQLSFTECTNVYFRALTQWEIEHYVDNYRPFDKAGAYGIQEWIGMIGIERIEGDYYNVMGLPLYALYKALQVF